MSNEKIESIIALYNGAVTEYNKIIRLRESGTDDSKLILEEFSRTCMFFTAMENAINFVLENKGEKIEKLFHLNVNKFILKASPNPLEVGIDLLYLLKYRETRNEAIHAINILKENPYPRLFKIGAMFINRYLKTGAELKQIIEDNTEIDYGDFLQNCNDNFIPYDHTYILIVGSMHDFDEKQLAYLASLPWSIVLDFDCWSKHNGMKAVFNQVKEEDLLSIHLQDINNYSEQDLYVKDCVWLYCDGEVDSGVSSCCNEGTIPTQLKYWKDYKCPQAGGKKMQYLLNLFFTKYFSQKQDDTTIVNLMDYEDAFHPLIENSLSNIGIDHNYIFINDTLNNNLISKVEDNIYSDWIVYNCKINDLVKEICHNKKTFDLINTSENILIPHNESTEADGIIEYPVYKNLIRYFDILHNEFPTNEDIIDLDEKPYHEILCDYARGAVVDWRIIKAGDAVEFANLNKIYKKIQSILSGNLQETVYYSIKHKPGYGGTTIAKQLAWKLHNSYPVLYMKEYSNNFFLDLIRSIYSCSRKRIIVFIEEKLINNAQKEMIINSIKSSSLPVLIIFVGRRNDNNESKEAITTYTESEIDKLIEFNKKVLAYTPDKDNKFITMNAREFLRNIDSQLLCPFIVSLSIYKEKFIKLREYAEEFAPIINEVSSLKSVFIYLSICSIYIDEGLPTTFVSKLLKTDKAMNKTTKRSLLPIKLEGLYYKYCDRNRSTYYAIRHPKLAEELLRVLVSEGNNYSHKLLLYVLQMIDDVWEYMGNTNQAHELLKKLFINKSVDTNEFEIDDVEKGNIIKLKKCFSPLIGRLLIDNTDIAGKVFEKLTQKYPNDPYYFAHSARYYAYTKRSVEDARKNAEKAIQLQEKIDDKGEMKNAAPDIYHIKGMCIRQNLYDELTNCKHLVDQFGNNALNEDIYTKLINLVEEAAESFESTKKYAADSNYESVEYACYAWLQMLVRVLNDLNNFEFKKNNIYDNYIEIAYSLIDELEENFYYTGNEARYTNLNELKIKLNEFKGDINLSIQQWNNFYANEIKSGNYSECLRACRRRVYLYIDKYNGAELIPEKNIESLVNEYEKVILESDSIDEKDIKLYFKIARYSKIKTIDSIASMLETLYINQNLRKDHIILFYRYILQFIRAYDGILEGKNYVKQYLNECKKKSLNIPNKINNLEFFGTENGIRNIINRSVLIKKLSIDKSNNKRLTQSIRTTIGKEIYTSSDLGTLTGTFRYINDAESYIIPNDKYGSPIPVKVFVRPSENPKLSSRTNDRKVTFKLGFSFDGLRAENMSINVVSTNKKKTTH